MNTRTARVLLIAGALLLSVLLFIAPKIAPANSAGEKNSPEGVDGSSATIEVYASMATKSLEPALKERHDSLMRAKSFDSIAAFWDTKRRPDLAAYYLEQKAGSDPENLFHAGNRYYYAVQFCQDNSEIPALYQSAIRCFSKGLQKDPQNTDARIMLASCYVEGSADPMKGITMMREIEKRDSSNVKLQLSFAAFSMKSGQIDKAVGRFWKVLRIDSNYIEAYLHLADAYEQIGNKEATIEVLRKYAERTPDVTARLEVNKYIKQLSNK